jgi:hypothetical protein
MTFHMTPMLGLKQGMLELTQMKRFVSSPGNGAVYPTESLIEKRGAPSKSTGDFQGNNVSQQESDTACLQTHSKLAGQTKEVPSPSSRAACSDCHKNVE